MGSNPVTLDHICLCFAVIFHGHRCRKSRVHGIFIINLGIGGIIYDVIVEPPSVGSTTDEHGHTRPVAFMPYRVNGQYIMEVFMTCPNYLCLLNRF